MRCAECAAEVPPLREFCPKCGAPTDPGLRERRHQLGQPRSTGELNSNRKKVLIIGGGILLSLGALTAGNWINAGSDERSGIQGPPEARGPVTIEAEQLYQAYRDNPHGSAERFDGREMVVSGEFLRIVPDGYGSLDLRLKTSNPEVQLGIDLAQLAIEDGKKLRPGQRVTVSCQSMGGFGEELWVRDCAIQPAGETSVVPALPATTSEPAAPAPPAAPEAAAAPEEENNG